MPTERLLMRQIREIPRLRWACRLPQRAVARRKLSGRRIVRSMRHAGEKAFVDFSGQRPVLCDPKTGELIPVELFIGVLGASNYTYAEACLTQDLPAWISVHVRMLEYFHGSPGILVPDSLRSGVTQACRYEPMINRTYLAFARHYGIAIVPARSGRPRDKAKAEAGVLLAQRWILAALRHRRFFRVAELNAVIRELLTPLIAGGKLTQSRRSSQRSSGRLARDSVWRTSSHCCEIP